MSDEIGHFENCKVVDPASFNCSVPGDQEVDGTLDEDDANGFCVPGEDSTLVKINGCFSADEDYDGQSYLPDWPGTLPDPVADQALHPSPLRFTSPLANGKTNYSTIQFETDLPRIEADDSQDNPPFCDRITGDNCVNPPAGAKFYPFFTTGRHDGGCAWQEGGNFIPGTIEHFGGSSTTEFGPLLSVLYPDDGFTPIHRINDFNSGDLRNPCPANRRGGDD